MRFWAFIILVSLSFGQVTLAAPVSCHEKSLLFPTYNVSYKQKIMNLLVNNLSGLKSLDQYYKQAMSLRKDSDKSPWRLLLEALEINFKTNKPIEEAIPKEGPLVVYANHPFGGIDGIALLDFITRTRGDVKLMINKVIVERMTELEDVAIPIELRKRTAEARADNKSRLEAATRHVQDGGALIIFPAGSMANSENIFRSFFASMAKAKSIDKPWKPGIGQLAQIDDVTLLPIFFHGGNSSLFHTLGKLPKLGSLRNALLIKEIVNKRGLDMNVSIGDAIIPSEMRELLEEMDSDQLVLELRRRAESLKANTDGL